MKLSGREAQQYKLRVRRHRPPRPVLRNLLAAFMVGGTICLVGQVVLTLIRGAGTPLDDATSATAAVMILLGAILTGLGIYDEVGRFGGMGAALPITGFANAIVAPAMDYKREGYVLGVGARMFSIAGPVVVYGLLTSIISAAIRYWMVGP